jgi:hypothetical protein
VIDWVVLAKGSSRGVVATFLIKDGEQRILAETKDDGTASEKSAMDIVQTDAAAHRLLLHAPLWNST